ncbi:MAG: hypothetical protein U0744_13610 [Gemmataceae bacterium]
MKRNVLSIAMMCLALGCDGRRVPVNDFNQGFNQGVESVREVRHKQGPLGNLGLQAAEQIGVIPTNAKKSADWNAGFREGIRSELKR